MEVIWVLCFFVGVFKLCNGFTISDSDYQRLPPIYDMDDYGICKAENNLYCKIKFILKPKNGGSIWEVIQNAKKEPKYYFHDIIYRKKCIPKFLDGNTEGIIQYSTKLENKKLENFSLSAYTEEIECYKYASYTTFDYIILFAIAVYLAFIIYATVRDILSRSYDVKRSDDKSSTQINKYLLAFSVTNNWRKMKSPITTFDYHKLKSLQGIKVYNLIIVISCHTVMNIGLTFVSNTRFSEEYRSSISKRLLTGFCLHIIQTNFLISGWLFTVSIYNAVIKNGKLTYKDIIQAILFRYLRFIFPLIVYISVHRSSLLIINFDGPQNDLMHLDNEACKTYWWTTLFFINNFFYLRDMCNIATWFLSCYFQMFIIFLFLFYLIFKLKLPHTVILVLMMIISWLIHGYIIYRNNLGAIFVLTPEAVKLENFIASYPLYMLYTTLYCNFEGFVTGIIFGTIYYRYRNRTIAINKLVTALWAFGFLGLPVLVTILTLFEYSPITSAVIGASLKPLFAIGIGIGVLGMSFNIGGFVKEILECRFVEFVATWSYSTYIFHFSVIILRSVWWESLIVMSDLKIITTGMQDIVASFAVGFILHLLIDAPFSNALNILFRPKQK